MSEFLSFRLSDSFVEQYANKSIPWGFNIHEGLSLGDTEILKKVSRWRIYALYRGRKNWRWSLSKHVQAELDLLLDNCNSSM